MKNKNIQKADFTEKNLPQSRTAQYGQLLKDNYLLFLKLGFILLTTLIPFIASLIVKGLYETFIRTNESFSDVQKAQMMISSNLIFNAIFAVCIIIFFIFLGGVLKIMRRLIWNEPLFMREDFFMGVKENIGHFSLIGFLIGLLNFISVASYYLLPRNLKFIAFIIAGISLVLIIPILVTTSYISSIYTNKFSTSLVMGGRVFIRRGIFIFLVLLILYSFYFVSFIPINLYFLVLIIALLIIFVLPLWLLLSYLNAFKNFDDLINIYYYPENAYLGLYLNEEMRNKVEKKQESFKKEK